MEEYDTSLAVQAIRTLFLDASSNEDCQKLVWDPTHFWLQRLSDENPQKLSCLHEIPLPDKKSGGYSCNIYLIVPEKKIIYLGTILSKEEAKSDFLWFRENFPERADELEKRGPLTILRWWSKCNIPVDAQTLTQEAVQQGVKKYLREFAPKLAEIPVDWLPESQQKTISREIFFRALLTAKQQSKEERMRITSNNL